ncbi:hypothetical protein RRG08_067011 [Elysia crispata]|uniref:Uncharacterized protein n=1 Tax=Elysia crispata TaxID=231223 RepID=A0AAE0Z9F3_9GAST|nr:hypothetical protein RRG08_067011 [Elysia crispata]
MTVLIGEVRLPVVMPVLISKVGLPACLTSAIHRAPLRVHKGDTATGVTKASQEIAVSDLDFTEFNNRDTRLA